MKQQSQDSDHKRGFGWWSKRVALAGGALILVLGVLAWVTGGAASSDLIEQYSAPGQSADVMQSLPVAESETETAAEAPSGVAAKAEVETGTAAEAPSGAAAEAEAETGTAAEAPSEAVAEAEAETDTEPQGEAESEAETSSFATDVMPIFEERCADCHSTDGPDGGWDASGYELVLTTGDHGPVVIPGDVVGSLLAQKLVDVQEEGGRMPPWPVRKLSDDQIQAIFDWIAAGAPE